jgi:signal transduction histidine kinase
VGNLRDLASPAQGVRVPVDLRKGLESTLTLLRRSLDEVGVAVELRLPDAPMRVNADAGALNQVFLNLVKNSAEAMEGRTGTIWIEGATQDGHVSLVLRDNGPGVSQEARDRLFEPFFTTKVAGRGSGLGLSICQRIVTEHGGTIVLSSPPGEGATFTVRLPEEGGQRSSGA